jgi:hypothetical protein
MTGPWTIRESGMLAGAVLLSLSIAYFAGKHSGQLDARLSINAEQLKKSDDSVKSIQSRTDSSKAITKVLFASHDVIRTKIKVVHDTILLSGGINQGKDSLIAVSPDIARLIATDDSLIAAQAHSLALQDTLIASLRTGLSLRDSRIKLLESEVTPGKLKRIVTAAKWIAIGAVVGVAYQHR